MHLEGSFASPGLSEIWPGLLLWTAVQMLDCIKYMLLVAQS